MTQVTNRGKWTSQLTFILALTGAAVGLGNIWKFPYMAGDNGGSAFVLIYLLAVLFIGLPVMVAEIVIGRRTQKNPVDALRQVAIEEGRTRHWSLLGWWGIAGLLLTLSFYSVVAGWSIFYLVQSLTGHLANQSNMQIQHVWQHLMSSPGIMAGYHLLFMALTLIVVARGVEKGLEKANVYMMPILFVILIVLVVYAGIEVPASFKQSWHFLFDFRFKDVTGGVIINAVGHAFFTLAVGVGAMEMYGSYLSKDTSIGRSVIITAILDVMVAFLAGMAIFPILFHNHLAPQEGPGLMFLSLPMAFSHMVGGYWIGTLFFALLLFAAWTSSINIAEPIVAMLYEKTRLSRGQVCWVVGLVTSLLGLVSVFSFNIWSSVRVFGHFDLFTAITDLSTNIFLPIGGIFYAIFAGWVMRKQHTYGELGFESDAVYHLWLWLSRVVAPAGILVVFISAFW